MCACVCGIAFMCACVHMFVHCVYARECLRAGEDTHTQPRGEAQLPAVCLGSKLVHGPAESRLARALASPLELMSDHSSSAHKF